MIFLPKIQRLVFYIIAFIKFAIEYVGFSSCILFLVLYWLNAYAPYQYAQGPVGYGPYHPGSRRFNAADQSMVFESKSQSISSDGSIHQHAEHIKFGENKG